MNRFANRYLDYYERHKVQPYMKPNRWTYELGPENLKVPTHAPPQGIETSSMRLDPLLPSIRFELSSFAESMRKVNQIGNVIDKKKMTKEMQMTIQKLQEQV